MLMKYDFEPKSAKTEPSQAPAQPSSDLEKSLERLDQAYPDLDAIVLTSKDPFMSEYVPVDNNPRYGATRFTGSVGDCIYWTKKFRKFNPNLKPVSLFVDGRYHLQADQETDLNLVEVVKLDVEPNIEGSVIDRLSGFNGIKVGLDFERTSIATLIKYRTRASEKKNTLVSIEGEKILTVLSLPGWKIDRPIFSVPESATGRSTKGLLRTLTLDMHARRYPANAGTLYLTCATDDAAFLLNARGFHLPHTASFLAYTFFVDQELIVFLPASSKNAPMQIDEGNMGEFKLTVIRDDIPALKAALKEYSVDQIFFDGSRMNGLLPSIVMEVFPNATVDDQYQWLLRTRAQKTPAEMNSIRTSFLRSSRAIAKTLRYGKSESQKQSFSEIDLANYLYQCYADEGAVALSFKTISGAGPHSAIVHYSNPQATSYFEKGMIALLDSGAYYSEGFCTDCTRGFFVGGGNSGVKPEAWQKDIYTATLKSAIEVFIHPVDAKLTGKEVDALIRGKVKAAGYDYMHGTGHGIGIHVHEEGIRLSTLSIYPQSPYACVSVEPGIYLQGKGGVRVENVALLIPEGSSHYRYENVAFVGYDWDLIDLDKLTNEEKVYLKAYEAKCRELGTELVSCPLEAQA